MSEMRAADLAGRPNVRSMARREDRPRVDPDSRNANHSRLRLIARVQAYKEQQGCADCEDRTLPHYCLDFDHRPGEIKVGHIANLVTRRGEPVVWAEVAKCDVVCANCHRKRTWAEKVQLTEESA